MRSKHLPGVLILLIVLFLTWGFTQPSAAQGGYEWNHWDIGEGVHYTTGKSSLAAALDLIEGAGWDVRVVVARPAGGYAVIGRGPKGTYTPQPVTPTAAPHTYSAPTTATIACPGTHHACRVLPPGTYEKAVVDRIGR